MSQQARFLAERPMHGYQIIREIEEGSDGSWKPSAEESNGSKIYSLPKAGMELAQAAAQVGRTGTSKQVQEAVKVLEEARRRNVPRARAHVLTRS